MSLPDTHLELLGTSKFDRSAWDRTELRLPQQKLAIPVAIMVELWEMKWKRPEVPGYSALMGGPTWSNHSLFTRRNASVGIPAMSSAKDA